MKRDATADAAHDAATRATREAEIDGFDAIEAEVQALSERCLRRLSMVAAVLAALLLIGVAWWSRYVP
jgi:hypothetical protein